MRIKCYDISRNKIWIIDTKNEFKKATATDYSCDYNTYIKDIFADLDKRVQEKIIQSYEIYS